MTNSLLIGINVKYRSKEGRDGKEGRDFTQ